MFPDDEHAQVRGALATLLDPEPPMRTGVADDVRRGRALRLRRQRWYAGGAAAAVVLGAVAVVGIPRLDEGSATGISAASPSATGRIDRPAAYDPTGLFGYWTVGGTGTPDDDATLQFGSLQYEGSVTLYRTCGGLDGSWLASPAGGFVANLHSGDAACFADAGRGGTDPTPGWLAAADTYRPATGGIELLDRDGAVVARLVPGTRPTVGANRSPDGTKQFDLTPEIRAGFTSLVVPDGVVPAPRPALVGRWAPTKDYGQVHPYLELAADGTYRSSDGCNARGGRWTVDASGVPLATSGPTTAIGCLGVDPMMWMTEARAATVDGGTLTFVDQGGRALGTLTRS